MHLLSNIPILLVGILSCSSYHILDNLEHREKLEEQLHEYKVNLKARHVSSMILFYVNNAPECHSIITRFIKRRTRTLMITSDTYTYGEMFPDDIFVFVERLEDILETLDNLLLGRHSRNRSRYHFVVCKEYIGEKIWVKSIMNNIWKRKIFNFVLLIVHGRLRVLAFNKFRDEFLDYTNITKAKGNLFPNKLSNLHGYKLKVGMIDDGVLNTRENGIWQGPDVRDLNRFIRSINATVQIIPIPFRRDFSSMYGSYIDFPFWRAFPTLENLARIEFIPPSHKDSLKGIVPQSEMIPPITYFYMLYNWDCLVVIFIIMILVGFIAKLGRSMDLLESVYVAIICAVNGNVHRFWKRPTSTKILFVSCMLFFLIVNVLFELAITTMLFTKQYYPDIDTIQQLDDSELEIFVDSTHVHILPYSLKDQIIPLQKSEITKLIAANKRNAYVATESFILWVMQSEKIQSVIRFTEKFHVMKESVVLGYNTYIFPKGCPYIEQISHFFQIYTTIQDHRYLQHVRKSIEANTDLKMKMLRTDHWFGILLILVVGNTIAVVVFFIEIILYKVKK